MTLMFSTHDCWDESPVSVASERTLGDRSAGSTLGEWMFSWFTLWCRLSCSEAC